MFFLELSCFFDDPTNVGNLISDASAFSKTSLNIWKFLSDQCKEIKKNNRMGKTKDLFKKIRDTKGTFHAKMGTIKETARTQQKLKILRKGGNNTLK